MLREFKENMGRVLALGFVAVTTLTVMHMPANANDLRIYTCDVSGRPGDLVEVPIWVENDGDTLAGFDITLGLDRNRIVDFVIDTVIEAGDTTYYCPFDTTGTLTSGWDIVSVTSRDGSPTGALTVVGISQYLEEGIRGIPFATMGYLMRITARIRDDIPDTLTNRSVTMVLHDGLCSYSNTMGELITSHVHYSGLVTAEMPCDCAVHGDSDGSGSLTPIDVINLNNYVFKYWMVPMYQYPNCPAPTIDVNCDDGINPLDVVYIVNRVYRGWDVLCEPCDCAEYPIDCP
jgi:hypothetical protein